MNPFAFASAVLVALLAFTAPLLARDEPIPARPEQLRFPPLDFSPPQAADYRHPLKSGPVAYIVPDRELPLVNIQVLVRTGRYLEPEDKAGLASLTGQLITRSGTTNLSAREQEERLAFLAANLASAIEDTQGVVALNLLSKDLDEGLAMLRAVLATPRFEEERLRLSKLQLIQAMRQRNDDTGDIEAREASFLQLGENFWANHLPTLASVTNLSRADLLQFHQLCFHPSNFVIAASGDFDSNSFLPKLDATFADWPFPQQPLPAIGTNLQFAAAGAYIVDKEVNQGRVSLLLPGILRDHPDYFPVLVMNEILGGGGFTSRIMNRVRSDEGLAYSAYSAFPGGVYYPSAFEAGLQTKSRTVPYALSLVLEELRRIATEPVTTAELATAQRSFIDQFPRIFATKAATAALFAREEFTGRYFTDPEFYPQYRARFARVTREDVLRVAQRYLHPDRAVVLIVGQKADILLGHPNHTARLTELVDQRIVDLPLRDPLTLQPLSPRPPHAADHSTP